MRRRCFFGRSGMAKVVVSLTDEEVCELREIVIDRDGEEALKFLKEKILLKIERTEKRRMSVDGKRHL